ncbi:MAG TPA: hypothetical protein VE591_12050 [Candidatus Acidoferrum sp.]|jgi:hypothetical protein|nr:hypothetical protein [Candidatus Acidoferrum sp.]
MDFGRQLSAGQTLGADDTVTASNKAYQLVMQRDGNLVIYHLDAQGERSDPTWASNTTGNAGAQARLQDDGNLVVYRADGTTPLWASNTANRRGANLQLGDDGSLALALGGQIVWTARGSGIAQAADQIGGAAESALGSLKEQFSKLTNKPR